MPACVRRLLQLGLGAFLQQSGLRERDDLHVGPLPESLAVGGDGLRALRPAGGVHVAADPGGAALDYDPQRGLRPLHDGGAKFMRGHGGHDFTRRRDAAGFRPHGRTLRNGATGMAGPFGAGDAASGIWGAYVVPGRRLKAFM